MSRTPPLSLEIRHAVRAAVNWNIFTGGTDNEENQKQKKQAQSNAEIRKLAEEMAFEEAMQAERQAPELSHANRNYGDVRAGDNVYTAIPGGGHMGRRTAGDPSYVPTSAQLSEVVANTPGRGTLHGVANLARNMRGMGEAGNNGGPLVRAAMGYEGDPWCGGFVNYVFAQAGLPGIYPQTDFRLARSYMREAERHGAFHSGQSQRPQVGDVVVFTRGANPQSGHVGIIVAVNGDEITYVSGNDGNQVTERTFNRHSPPPALLGYSDTRAIARARGIVLSESVMTQSSPDAAAPPAPPQAAAAASGTSTPPPTQMTGGETVSAETPTALPRVVVPAAGSSPGLP